MIVKNELETYLNEHLAGSAGGLILAEHLAETATDEGEKSYFDDLKNRISRDRDTLIEIITESGFTEGAVRHAVGSAMARFGVWRMDRKGMNIGELGRFEMIELLAVGIHGKCLLWRTLHLISELYPEWHIRNFIALEKSATCQSLSIEGYRSREALKVFSSPESSGDVREQYISS